MEYLKIGQQLKFLWHRDFALAREVINDHENGCFSKVLLYHVDFVLGTSFVSFCNEIEQS